MLYKRHLSCYTEIMKRGMVFIILASFIALTAFGFVMMIHEDTHAARDCAFIRTTATDCQTNGTLASALLHVDSFWHIITGLSIEAFIGFIVGVLLLFATLVLFTSRFLLNLRTSFIRRGERLSSYSATHLKDVFTRWLARHEASPTVV